MQLFDLCLKLLPAVGSVVARLPEFKDTFDRIVESFGENDQDTLKAAYADLIADNDEGHARLQEKLARAASE